MNVASAVESVPAAGRTLSLKMCWAILALLSLGVMISNVDRSSMSSAIAAESFKADFGLSNIGKGWLNSAFFWSYGVFHLLSGYVVDRYGVKWPYTLCFALWCLATAVTGFMDTLAGLVAMRLIIGAAESMAIPASFRWIRNNFGEARGGVATGIIAAGNKLGPAIGAPVAIWLIQNYSWRDMFFATGVVGLFWLVPWVLAVPSDFPNAQTRVAQKTTGGTVPLSSLLASPVVWGSMVVSFCYSYFTFFCMQWMPDYLHNQRGLSLEKSGAFTFFSFAGIATVAILSGWIADRMIARGANAVRTRKAFTIVGYVGACTILFGARTKSLDLALFWNIFSLTCLGLTTANQVALCRITLIPKAAVGMVTGIQQFATSMAGGVAGALTGWLLSVSNNNYDLPMLTIVVFCVTGAATTLIVLRPQWAPKISHPA